MSGSCVASWHGERIARKRWRFDRGGAAAMAGADVNQGEAKWALDNGGGFGVAAFNGWAMGSCGGVDGRSGGERFAGLRGKSTRRERERKRSIRR